MAKPDIESTETQETGNRLIDGLNAAQRQRLSGTVNTLEQQGAAPADAWTAATAMQKQKDVPGYTPEDDEQDALNRVSQQAREQTPETEIAAISVDAALGDSEDATGSSSDSDGSGMGLQQERLQPTGQDPQQNAEKPSAATVVAANLNTTSTDSESDGDRVEDDSDDSVTGDDETIAQDVLENARAYLDTAVAQGELNQPPGNQDRLRAENDRYVVERDSDGVVTLQNKETNGYLVGDSDGKLSATKNLSQTDQEAWRGYRQEQQEQQQNHRNRQKQRQQRRRERTQDLEL